MQTNTSAHQLAEKGSGRILAFNLQMKDHVKFID